jgi:membrane protein DedA with SNARE-associated domain
MLSELITYIQEIVFRFGPWGVFLASFLEEVIFFVPSPVVPMTAGFFLISPDIQLTQALVQVFLQIALPVAIGLSLGSLFPYGVFYFGGRRAIEKWGHFMGLSWESIEKIENKFARGYRDELALLILRLSPVPSVAISSFCGIIRYPVLRFAIITAFGALVRGFILGIIGWQIGEEYMRHANFINQIETYVFALIGVVVTILIIRMILKRRGERN